MRIFVCIKQVPATSVVAVDEHTGVLRRGSAATKMNPYDLFALEVALQLRAERGGSVAVGTMGPPGAEAIVREAYWMGADGGYLLCDRRLAGADVLATGYALAQCIRAAGDFDLILCGKQTTDGDTAQVGPALAEQLGIPHAAWVLRIEADESSLVAEQQLQDRIEAVRMPYPCLITVEQDILTPRLPSMKRAREVADRPVRILTLDDLPDPDPAHYGLDGSATQVERIFVPAPAEAAERWEGAGLTERLFAHLKAEKYI